jgi:signal transduction histidine kinase
MLAIFCVSVALMVLMGYDLEDQIFAYQINQRADSLALEINDEDNLTGKVQAIEMEYFVGLQNLPEWIKLHIDPDWAFGTYEIFAKHRGHYHVAIRHLASGESLYLLFNARPYIKSTPHIVDYLKIIALMGGITIMVSVYFTQLMAKRISQPIERMTQALSQSDSEKKFLRIDTSYVDELHALSNAIIERDQRIRSLMERERQFNRDVSHELRTPLTIAMGSIELMEETHTHNKPFLRLQSAIIDMQILTEGVLWLGREANKSVSCDAYKVCKRAIENHTHMLRTDAVDVEVGIDSAICIPVPEPVAFVIIGNILRNALTHTNVGKVIIRACQGEMSFDDTGVGYGNASEQSSGFGIGLSLVERLCQHFGLTFNITPMTGSVGSRVRISWSDVVLP